jgi:hypothetical protein
MARYNTIQRAGSTLATSSFITPESALFTTLGGTAPYTVTMSSPVTTTGQSQSFYNSTAGTITLSTPSGTIKGPGFTAASTQTVPPQATYTLTSDGVGYIISNNEGGPQLATTLTASGTITAQGIVNLNPADANVSLAPTGTGVVTINPATSGTLNNVVIGGSNAKAATFTTVTLNTSMDGAGTIDGGTF